MTKTPRTKASKRRLIVLICVIVATLAIVLAGGFATNGFNPTPKETTSTTAPLTEDEQKAVAEQSSSAVFDIVMANVVSQIGQNNADVAMINTSGLLEDANGKPAKVAVISVTNLDASFDYEKSVTHVEESFKSLNVEGEDIDWNVVISDETTFAENESILKAIKIYDNAKNPINPAIIEVSYVRLVEGETTTYEIYISSTVY